jgi:hypothetical protein
MSDHTTSVLADGHLLTAARLRRGERRTAARLGGRDVVPPVAGKRTEERESQSRPARKQQRRAERS